MLSVLLAGVLLDVPLIDGIVDFFSRIYNFEVIVNTIIKILLWVVILTLVVCACLADLLHNPEGHKRKFVMVRFVNWFTIGITYAMSYFGRYNINTLNVEEIREKLNVSDSMYGFIITIGFWGYAFFVFINGMMVDRIGARNAVIVGALGSGLSNLVMGFFSQFSGATGWQWVIGMCILFGINNYAQTYSTAAIVKAGVNWYPLSERGFFSGIFGVIISFGFFMAFQVNGEILNILPWYFLFYIPGIVQIFCSIVCFFVIRSTPYDYGFSEKHFGTHHPPTKAVADKKEPLWKLFKIVLFSPVFLILILAEFMIGWCRDGVLSWYSNYMGVEFGVTTANASYALAAAGISIGGMFGSLSAGILSDTLFRKRRPPVAFIYIFLFIIALFCLLISRNAFISAIIIGFLSFFFSGAHGIVTSTCAMDFAGSAATGTAVGMLDGIQKVASGFTGFLMGTIYEKFNSAGWIISMMPAAIIAALCFLSIIWKKGAESKPEKTVDEDEGSINGTEGAPPTYEDESEDGGADTVPGKEMLNDDYVTEEVDDTYLLIAGDGAREQPPINSDGDIAADINNETLSDHAEHNYGSMEEAETTNVEY